MSDETQTSPSNDVVVVSSAVEPPSETTVPIQTYQLTLDGPLLKQQLTILKALLRQLPDNRVELAGVIPQIVAASKSGVLDAMRRRRGGFA